MNKRIPAECPECGAEYVKVTRRPPRSHDRGSNWVTYANCKQCDYAEWFD